MPFSLPARERLLGAPCADGLAETLVMAGHSSVQSLTWQLAIAEETSQKCLVMETAARVSHGQTRCSPLPAGCPGHLTAVLCRAETSWFGVTPVRRWLSHSPVVLGAVHTGE